MSNKYSLSFIHSAFPSLLLNQGFALGFSNTPQSRDLSSLLDSMGNNSHLFFILLHPLYFSRNVSLFSHFSIQQSSRGYKILKEQKCKSYSWNASLFNAKWSPGMKHPSFSHLCHPPSLFAAPTPVCKDSMQLQRGVSVCKSFNRCLFKAACQIKCLKCQNQVAMLLWSRAKRTFGRYVTHACKLPFRRAKLAAELSRPISTLIWGIESADSWIVQI